MWNCKGSTLKNYPFNYYPRSEKGVAIRCPGNQDRGIEPMLFLPDIEQGDEVFLSFFSFRGEQTVLLTSVRQLN